MAFALHDPVSGDEGDLLIMPGWRMPDHIGIKSVTIWRSNKDGGLPSHTANYILTDAKSGAIVAAIDGAELTAKRTAAVSVMAARRLLRNGGCRLLIIGTGPIARNLALAHKACSPDMIVEIFGRNPERAAALAQELRDLGQDCAISRDLRTSVLRADMISTATNASMPIFDGAWVRPGTHLDLIGSFKPNMREVDDLVVSRASQIWIDDQSALTESGDISIPISSGVISADAIVGDLPALLSSARCRDDDEITIFKSVGYAIPDLAAALTLVEQYRKVSL